MSATPFTKEQRRAIETAGCDVVVAAGAGSGKTAVLAERCAHLVCDAPPPARCDADQLLVLTFTDAAAAEMRARIVEAIRRRARLAPADARLRRQAALVDAAAISTIHAFCHSLVRRHFVEADIDPAAALMDEDEAVLLRGDVLDALFESYYERGRRAGTGDLPPDDPARRFMELVEVYGLGRDAGIAQSVRRLCDYLDSLPDPESWLTDAVAELQRPVESIAVRAAAELRAELERQHEHVLREVEALDKSEGRCAMIGAVLDDHAAKLAEWSGALAADNAAYDRVRGEIAGYELTRSPKTRRNKNDDGSTAAALDAAIDLFDLVTKDLLGKRLKPRFGRFTAQEWADGLHATAPFAATWVDLARAFRSAYVERKRALGVLDFADLERLALGLLRSGADGAAPATNRGSSIAAALRSRFAHVLVDEFQDVNPVQAAIVDLLRRGTEEGGGNLFVVGDVKQSIYRFRLAEPSILVERWQAARSGDGLSQAVPLSRNFRSRPEVIDFVNLVFAQLMRPGAGPIEYDEAARLVHGRAGDEPSADHRVELHLLERHLSDATPSDDGAEEDENTTAEDDAPRPFDPADPAGWETIEREAFLIGRRIREMMAGGCSPRSGERPKARRGAANDPSRSDERPASRSDEPPGPLRFKHFAVLLRSVKASAARVVAMLRSMGIPAYSGAGGDFLAALEVREVLAALHVLDNPRQDIPLASVLRTGLLGDAFIEDELVEIRCLDRGVPFHEAVFAYANRGPDAGLRHRLRRLRQHIQRERDEVRCRPLAEFLWSLVERSGYLAYVGGLPDGPQRRANLILLHERARTFGTFRLQGLHRFLRFIESMETQEREWPVGSPVGEGDDVVRVMSIHKAKGLEFPVVFVAGLGTRFNMQDRSGRMLFERQSGLGLRVVDSQRMIEYPSLAWQRVVEEIERTTRQEEMRIMYVAMTRARDKLVLVGTPRCKELASWLDAARRRRQPPSAHTVMNAASMLDWLVPVLASAAAGEVRWPGERTSGPDRSTSPEVCVHHARDVVSWRVEAGAEDLRERRRAASRLEPLPASEPVETEGPRVQAIMARMSAVYPHLPLASVPSVLAASAFKGAYDFTREGDEAVPIAEERREGTKARRHEGKGSRDQGIKEPRDQGADGLSNPQSAIRNPQSQVDPRTRGIVTHRVLQFLDFARATDRAGVAAEIDRLTTVGKLTPDERSVIDLDQLAWFVATDLAALIRRAGDQYHREFQVLTAEDPHLYDATIGPVSATDKILVRGIVDGLLEFEETLEIVDFKTDELAPPEVAARALHYASQLELYARAMERLWRRPVACCRLVFLAARAIVPVERRSLTMEPAPSA